MSKLLILEPFYGGSHKQLLDTLTSKLEPCSYHMVTLPAKKWHWRARTSSLKFSQMIPSCSDFTLLFSSSVISLAELLGLRPDLIKLKKIVYFHENQLCYPVQNVKERDFQFGYNQITTCLAADVILFNSEYNLQSFLTNIPKFLSLQPDHKPDTKLIISQIKNIAQVCYFPLQLPVRNFDLPRNNCIEAEKLNDPLHIVWPHRWEHDKDPETFCNVILKLHEAGLDFIVSMLGEVYSEVPEIITRMKQTLSEKIKVFGYLPSKQDYFKLLSTAHVVVSTAKHEFYGVSMLEAAWLGCYPIAPNNLVYPEIYPQECLYNTEQQLFKKLSKMCSNPISIDTTSLNIDFVSITGEAPLKRLLSIVTGCDN